MGGGRGKGRVLLGPMKGRDHLGYGWNIYTITGMEKGELIIALFKE